MAEITAPANTSSSTSASKESKPKRVRTGCLTCRERHLKCDEAPGECMNCRKSQRECRRGVRLNFIDTKCDKIPEKAYVPREQRQSGFMDESREIASEYQGGLQAYGKMPSSVGYDAAAPISHQDYESQAHLQQHQAYQYNAQMMAQQAMPQQQLPPAQSLAHNGHMDYQYQQQAHEQQHQQQQQQRNMSYASVSVSEQPKQEYEPLSLLNSATSSSANAVPRPHPAYNQSHDALIEEEQSEIRDILNTAEETLFMQVFVEEVGLWMDSMDSMKHFSRLLPFHALTQPMLLNAFLACGVRHLTLVNPAAYSEEKALNYYDKASRYLLRALQNPDRDSVICATTAVILNVYEIMTEKALPRMNHIAGARALIKECGWDARSTGIGAACFWLNVGMELLSNLHFNWQASWHPDTWGLDLDLSQETEMCKEEVWTHRIVYICAKVGDFRATIPRQQESSPHNEAMRRRKRTEEWDYLRGLCDTWNTNVPRTMQPMAYLYPYQATSGSSFPEIWLIKRSTIVARLLYHTAMTLLAQVHPMKSKEVADMHEMEQFHAHQICGIAAHVKDRGVASVALRSLAIAAECLTVRREQEEVLQLFMRIHRETGWRIGFIPKDLAKSWGWDHEPSMKLPTHDAPRAGLGLAGSRFTYDTGAAAAGAMQGSGYAAHQFDQYADVQQKRQQAAENASATSAGFPNANLPFSQTRAAAGQNPSPLTAGSTAQSSVATPPRKQPPAGIVNPMYTAADFSAAKHPYQDYYVAPSHIQQQQAQREYLMAQQQQQQQQQYAAAGAYALSSQYTPAQQAQPQQQQQQHQHQQGPYVPAVAASGAYAGPGTMAHASAYGQGQGQQGVGSGQGNAGGLGLHVPMQTQAAQLTGSYAPYLPLPDPNRMQQ